MGVQAIARLGKSAAFRFRTLKSVLKLYFRFSGGNLDRGAFQGYTSGIGRVILMLQSQKNMSSDVQVLKPDGILDGTKAGQFRRDVLQLVDKGVKTILIDFKDVTFMDSSGLGALVLALKTVRAADGQLVICSINEQIKILFELTSMDRVFEIFSSQEEFESKLNSTS
jgi:anti-sigma B factor antagonist